MPDFLLPDLGEGLTDAEIISWLVAVGDVVAIDQPVVEVETAKASVEVPVPFAGRVSAVFGAPGERILVGSPLITVTADNGADPAARPDERPQPGSLTAPTAAEAKSSEYSGNVLIGYGTSTSPARRRSRVRRTSSPVSANLDVEAGLPMERSAMRGAAPSPHAAAGPVLTPSTAGPTRVATSVISPVVRKLARDRGIDLASVRASDPSGVIRRYDIESLAQPAGGPVSDASPSSPVADTQTPPAQTPERVPLVGLRKLAAERLSQSRREIPEATVWVDVDATGLIEARRALNTARPDESISLLALLGRFCVLGLRRYRELNSRISADAVELLPDINLGFAAQTDRGLMVPVVHHAERLTTRELSRALAERTAAGRAGSLTPSQLSGGTFTVNNYGVFGVDGSAAIINYPEVAMLGMGRIIDRPWVVDGELAIRKVTQLTLAFDHRACDGAVAGGFLRFVADCVERPVTALGEL